jgi:hypothetical protein
VSDEPVTPEVPGQRELVMRLRAVIEAKDAELVALRVWFAGLRAELDAIAEDRRLLELRVGELEHHLGRHPGSPWRPPAGAHRGSVTYRPGLNVAALLLSGYVTPLEEEQRTAVPVGGKLEEHVRVVGVPGLTLRRHLPVDRIEHPRCLLGGAAGREHALPCDPQ